MRLLEGKENDMEKRIHLVPGWCLKHYEIPIMGMGKRTVRIKVGKGRVRLGHHIFDIQNGSWHEHPKGKPSFYLLDEGHEYILDFHIDYRHQRQDRLFLANEHFLWSAEISYELIIRE